MAANLVGRLGKALVINNINSQSSIIQSLRNNIKKDSIIFAAHLNELNTLIGNMNGHYHTYDDAFQLAIFGNNGDRTNYVENKNTNNINHSTNTTTQSQQELITASRHNVYREAINKLRIHFHGINDRTAI